MENFIRDFWGLLAAFVSAVVTGVVAFGRIEGRVRALEEEMKRHAVQRHEDLERERQDRVEIKAMLREMATEIKEMRREVRQ